MVFRAVDSPVRFRYVSRSSLMTVSSSGRVTGQLRMPFLDLLERRRGGSYAKVPLPHDIGRVVGGMLCSQKMPNLMSKSFCNLL